MHPPTSSYKNFMRYGFAMEVRFFLITSLKFVADSFMAIGNPSVSVLGDTFTMICANACKDSLSSGLSSAEEFGSWLIAPQAPQVSLDLVLWDGHKYIG